ncbi:MAG: discoidin domain-containing protein [Christensenellales bacterium]
MNKVLAAVFSVIIVAALAVAGLAYFSRPETPAEPATSLRLVSAPEQTQAERPSDFPDPRQNWIKLPESANLAAGKSVASGAVTEVYISRNATDGKLTTYWESKGLPAELTIDLEQAHTLSTVAVRLNPAPIWEPRTQAFEIQLSGDGVSYTTLVPNTKYEFNADTGNMVRVDFPPTSARFVKLLFTEKSSGRSSGAQAAEVEIFE